MMSTLKSFIQFQTQENIFTENQFGDCAYLIESGEVQIYKINSDQTEVVLKSLTAGEIFGEYALLSSNKRTSNARALSPVQCILIRQNQIIDKLSHSDELIQYFLSSILSKLINSPADEPMKNQILGKKLLEKLKKENQIIQAFNDEEFLLYHQPLVDLSNNQIIGSEALVRWNSQIKPDFLSEIEVLSPSYFIQYIEDSFLSIPFGNWVIENCFKDYSQLVKINPNFSISINISGQHFLHPEFISNIDALILKYKVNPKNFKIEIIERFLAEGDHFTSIIKKLKERGFQIALDDFGTGYSNLHTLVSLPIDYIKIDQSFVKDIFLNEKKSIIVCSILQLANELNLKVIAEGLETKQQVDYFKQLGCHIGQGYVFSKPKSLSDFLKLQ